MKEQDILFYEKLNNDKLKVDKDTFVNAVIIFADKLRVSPHALMAVMELETGGEFDPSLTNALGYTGLIQFGESAANEVGTTREKLRKMDAVEQLDYVYEYLRKYKSKIRNLTDLYFAIFFPMAIGKPKEWTLKTSSLTQERIAKWNPLFDTNQDNRIQVWEVNNKVAERLPPKFKYLVA